LLLFVSFVGSYTPATSSHPLEVGHSIVSYTQNGLIRSMLCVEASCIVAGLRRYIGRRTRKWNIRERGPTSSFLKLDEALYSSPQMELLPVVVLRGMIVHRTHTLPRYVIGSKAVVTDA
jgi:hypothetical protein